MLAAIRSAAVLGVDAYDVTVEVDAALGLPAWTIVGLAAAAVKESRERATAALLNAGFAVPPRRVTVNLSPADIAKTGSAFDLPIALAFLVATGQLDPRPLERCVVVGELGLDGTVRRVRGVLPIARRASAATEPTTLIVPAPNAGEALLATGPHVCAPPTLRLLIDWLNAGPLPAAQPPAPSSPIADDIDFADVVGQQSAKRALEVAAAGGHNVALVGPPGAGKTMLARRLATILPALTEPEALEVTAIHSVAGTLGESPTLTTCRPFRAPHHTISSAGLIGGGSAPRPGEVSLAHRGVLFLDEMLEFPRAVLDALRQPMEDGRVVIARASGSVAFPARFTLVGAMNPCPCGRAGDSSLACVCGAAVVAKYRARLSGPLADRIDMHVPVSSVPIHSLADIRPGERSQTVRERVEHARATQRERFAASRHIGCNAHAAGRWLDAHTPVAPAARALLADAADRLGFSARGYHRVLKVARTIADLDDAIAIEPAHVAEAVRYRPALPRTDAALGTRPNALPHLSARA